MTKTTVCAASAESPVGMSTFRKAKALCDVSMLRLRREIQPQICWTYTGIGTAPFYIRRMVWLGGMLNQPLRCPVSGNTVNLRIPMKGPAS
tara:strand:- start:1894 stop:2166 length:273 start_codon:yes stop_codon:yes gene_type:complete